MKSNYSKYRIAHFILLFMLIPVIPVCQEKTPLKPEGNTGLKSLQGPIWKWMNQPAHHAFAEDGLWVESAGGTDFFIDPESGERSHTAPFLFREVTGNFVAKIKVAPDFTSQWNAVALMVYVDATHWIKYAYEKSDATGPTVVSVVTKEVSDDANGAIVEESTVLWLKVVRKGDLFSLHWSLDDSHYFMSRLTSLPAGEGVKVGIEFQSPLNTKARHTLLSWELYPYTVKDLRQPEF